MLCVGAYERKPAVLADHHDHGRVREICACHGGGEETVDGKGITDESRKTEDEDRL